MNCAFDKEKLTGYYDGELEAAEKAEVERHIASCSECLRELGELKSSALLVKELPRLRAPRSIAEGVAREIQTAGKVHRFAKVRRNVLWACAAAAGLFIALNVAYFAKMESRSSESPVAARPAPTSIAAVPRPTDKSAPEAGREDLARRALDRATEDRERTVRAEERKNAFADSAKQEGQLKGDEPARKSVDLPRPAPAAEKPTVARSAEAKPAAEPAPPPAPPAATPKPGAAAPPAPVLAGKEEPRPSEPLTEKSAAGKKELEAPAKDSDAKAKRGGDPQGEAAPTHFTLASTQLTKARPVLEDSLKKMGVKIPSAPTAMMKGQASKPFRDETTFNLELTESQISRLKQDLEKAGHSRLVVGSPGDPVLAQFGDSGLYRKKDVASGGAPTAKKTAEAPKPAAPEAKEMEKDKDKDGKEEALRGTTLEGATEKAGEPKRKIVVHLLDVPFMPDPQPAGDPVKK